MPSRLKLSPSPVGGGFFGAWIDVVTWTPAGGSMDTIVDVGGVTMKEKKSAVKTTIEVTPPSGASQFFKVKFGE